MDSFDLLGGYTGGLTQGTTEPPLNPLEGEQFCDLNHAAKGKV